MDSQRKKRLTIWALFIISVGFVAAIVLPDHSVPHFFNLLKDVITHLVLG